MKKQYLIITLVLVVGALVATNLDKFSQGSQVSQDSMIGEPLLQEGDNSALTSITITKHGGDTLKLIQDKQSRWVIASDDSFPADASKILKEVKNLREAKFLRVVAKSESELAKFGLDTPDTLVLVQNEKVLKVLLGESRKGGGQYVSVGAGRKGYLASKPISLSTDTGVWEYKKLVDVKNDEIKSISFKSAGLTLSRATKEDKLIATGLKKGETDKSTNSSLDSLLAGLQFSKRYDKSNEEAKTALAKPSVTNVELFDGKSFVIRVGELGAKVFIDIQSSAADASVNQIMNRWFFEASSSAKAKFMKKRSDLVEVK